MIYLTISEGKTAQAASPIIASKDPDIVRAVLDALALRLRHPALAVAERPEGDLGVATR